MPRRMFSPQIIDSDAFLDMPSSAQALYFHLGMRADDDGFVGNPKKILRVIGGGEDDLKILIVKRFVLHFESGVVVIKHWRIHNYIQNDRYKPTVYLDEKRSLIIKENGSYTECIHDVSNLDAQVRLGKVRLGKDTNISLSAKPRTEREFANQRRQQLGKPPLTPRTPTPQQAEVLKAFKDGIGYFKQVGYEQHGMLFMEVENEQRNLAVRKLVISAHKNLNDLKPLINWWFAGAGAFANYEPEACFSSRIIERFKNGVSKTPRQGTWDNEKINRIK